MKNLYREWIARKIKHKREENRYTQKHIAEQIGIKTCTYASYEEARATPEFYIIKKICDFYKLSVDKFLVGMPD